MQDIKKLFMENGDIKFIIGTFMVFVSWSFNGEYQALMAIGVLRAMDFATGTHYAIKNKCWSSSKSTSGMAKTSRYFLYMLVARMIDKVVILKFASPMIDTYIVITEAGSIFENFYKLGYPVPTMLVNKLKTFYDKKGESNGKGL
jgi:toxin secretion/phage lysis holin